MKCSFFIASCATDGGLRRYEWQDGQVTLKEHIALDRPMYLAKDEECVYALLRCPFPDSPNSALVQIRNGQVQWQIDTKGVVAAHLCVEGQVVYCANYLSGNIVRLPDGKTVTHEGKSIHPVRQTCPHTHYVCLTPDGQYVLAVDLGMDCIVTYDRDLNEVSRSFVPVGHGARHLAYHNGYYYCANELASTVSVFAYEDGRLTLLGTYPALPADYQGESTIAAIRVKDLYVYVSNRGHDSITVFRIVGERLQYVAAYPCGGRSPRDFLIIQDILICTNELSDNVTFFKLCKDMLCKLDVELQVKTPMCVIEEK